LQQEVATLKQSLATKQQEIQIKKRVNVQLSGKDQQQEHARLDVDRFLALLAFPIVNHVDANQIYANVIPQLIDKLLDLKKGKKAEGKEFADKHKRLEHLLQSDVDIFEDAKGSKGININGLPYLRASAGTQIALSFFGLTQLSEQNCIILWDEPENGLHPTRRSRMLELMFNDGRQFILATHASEFAPVFAEQGKVFRCDASFDSNSTQIHLRVQHVADRRDAFMALEALGVHPAKTLFTANVVIWVEGPTELLFYRKWLVPRLEKRGLHEGFHFTFMQYGGALISYLEVADEGHFLSTFDLLSMCRHPVVIVDSDLKAEPSGNPEDYLKKGAARLLNEINQLNHKRPDGAMFVWTAGKEVENYLPESAIWYAVSSVWKSYETYQAQLAKEKLSVGKFDVYHQVLEKHFCDAGVVDPAKDSNDPPKAKGRSLWGAPNKVEMMNLALSMPDLKEESLKWGCSSLLQKVEEFIVQVCER
jgi:hypothetical protein